MADHDAAIEAAAAALRAAGWAPPIIPGAARAAVLAAAPLIRARVVEEVAARLDGEAGQHRHTTWDSLRKAAEFVREHAVEAP